jgi:REP element-mobilizing transposase RayT
MKQEFRRNLPHIYQKDAIYDINFRLADTIPNKILQDYLSEKQRLQKLGKSHLLHQLFNDHIDYYQDNSYSEINWLSYPEILDITKKAISFYENKRYKVICYCIMSNHVHLIINTFKFPYFPLGETLGSIKKYSARESNKLLNRKGSFWHSENYDRIIRDRNELDRAIKYVIFNPVNAGLIKDWSNWNGTYVDQRYLDL